MARFADAARLFFSESEVNEYNGEKVRGLGNPVPKSAANHNCATARRAPSDSAGGLDKVHFLAKDSKVMLTKHLRQKVGLVNGIRRQVVEMVYAEGKPAPAPPHYVVVRFDAYTGPPWSSEDRYSECVPIFPVDATCSSCGQNNEGNYMTRAQLPLKFCWV